MNGVFGSPPLDPRLLIVATTLTAATFLMLRNLFVLGAVVAVLVAAGILLPQIGIRVLGRRLVAVNVFSLILLLLVPWSGGEMGPAHLGGFSYSAGAALDVARIALQANAVVLAVTILLSPLDPIALGLAVSSLGAPQRIVQLYLFTLRYLRVLDAEYHRLRRAMQIRGFRPRANLHTCRTFGYLIGMLLIRALDRAERIWQAMLCRGFTGSLPATKPQRLSATDGVLFAAVVVALAAVLGVDRAVGGA